MCRLLCFATCVSLLSTSLFAWDPADETFDPTIHETIIDGASRLGDPSPVYREGHEPRGFTHVYPQKSAEGEVTINVSFIFTLTPEQLKDYWPSFIGLTEKEATEFAEHLEAGKALKKRKTIIKPGWSGKWTLDHEDERGMIISNEKDGNEAVLTLSLPAAKKLADAIRHSIQKGAAM